MGFFKNLKSLKRKEKGPIIKICPQCQTPNLYRTTFGSFTNTEFYKCRNCDYEGAFYIEVNPNETEANFLDLEKLKEEFPEFVEDPENP